VLLSLALPVARSLNTGIAEDIVACSRLCSLLAALTHVFFFNRMHTFLKLPYACAHLHTLLNARRLPRVYGRPEPPRAFSLRSRGAPQPGPRCRRPAAPRPFPWAGEQTISPSPLQSQEKKTALMTICALCLVL